jgi:hypothetical protein
VIPINNHRKLIFDKFYQWVNDNIDSLPSEVTDVTAEIWNLEEECEFWRLYASKLRNSTKENSMVIKNL